MKAHVKQNFKKGFFLNEENIIKLDDIITKRLKEKELDGKLTYKVYRSDSLVYETTEHKIIINEENSKRNLINRLEVFHDSENISFKMTYDKEENTRIEIEATEKDFAYLLFFDIKEYLITEVLKFREYKFIDLKIERWLSPLLMLSIMVIMFSIMGSPKLTEVQFNELMNSESIENKLNYLLIDSREKIEVKNIWYLLGATIIISLLLFSINEQLDKIYPRNIFYIGKEIIKYDKHCSIRSKFIWGLIAFITSAIAGLFVFYFTK